MGWPNEDQSLLNRCIAGDPEGWRAILKKYGALVSHAVYTTLQRVFKLPEKNQVDDAVQAVWVALCEDDCRRLRMFEAKASITTWLTVIATRKTLDFIRTEMRKGMIRQVRLDDEEHDLIKEVTIAPPNEHATPDEIEWTYEALNRLPDDDRLILKLYYLDGLKYRTIASLLGIAPNTVSASLMRAREKLKQILARPSKP